MRNQMILICVLAAPAAAFAHTGAHGGLSLVDGLVHMLAGHLAPLVAAGAVYLLSRSLYRSRATRKITRPAGGHRGGRS